MFKKVCSALCHILRGWGHLSNQPVDIAGSVGVALKGAQVLEGPRAPAERLHSHRCRTQTPWEEAAAAPGWHMVGGEIERDWLLPAPSVICRGHRTQSRVSVTLDSRHQMRPVCAHFTTNVVIRDTASLATIQSFLGEKRIHRFRMSSGVICAAAQAQRWVNSWRKWCWTCYQIQLLWVKKPQQLRTRTSENVGMVSMFLQKDQSAADEQERSCPATETPRCRVIPQTCLWHFKDAIQSCTDLGLFS